MHLCTCVIEEGGDGETTYSETPSLMSYTRRYVSFTEVGSVCRVALREPMHRNSGFSQGRLSNIYYECWDLVFREGWVIFIKCWDFGVNCVLSKSCWLDGGRTIVEVEELGRRSGCCRVSQIFIRNDYTVYEVVDRGVLLFFEKRKSARFLLHTLSITDGRMVRESFLL
jgi:hypothetical protein